LKQHIDDTSPRQKNMATACVLGDLEMISPLKMAGIRCAVVAKPKDPARYSRKVKTVGWADPRQQPDRLLELLLDYAHRQAEQPVLYYQTDESTLFLSQHRDELSTAYRLLLADEPLLLDLLSKIRFRNLAERLSLPVPPSQLLNPSSLEDWDRISLPFPLLVKPSTHSHERWARLEPTRKAIRVDSRAELDSLRPKMVAFGSDLLLQTLIAGPETGIESYHTYIDKQGETAAEFTGKKIRTSPVEFGYSTAVTITDAADVKDLGRDIGAQLGLRGVAKFDFKRDVDGLLWLLEVNPRYSLWNHLGAHAGVNVPALVWADLTGRSRPPISAATPGTSWFSPGDWEAAAQHGLSLVQWLKWARRRETHSVFTWSDPLPLLSLGARRWLRAPDQVPAGAR
jgi:predicted ATP-grasp superfamily ATP-dependent carboligase